MIWRAFVYSNETPDDRAKQAYNEFVPLDGKFADNVLVQVKNGADRLPAARTVPSAVRRHAEDAADDGVPDHQGVSRASRRTWRISAPLYEEALDAGHVWRRARARRWRRSIDGELHGYKQHRHGGRRRTSAPIATGRGSHFDQANWYAFGRLAWDPDARPRSHRRGMGAHDLQQRRRHS